MKPILNVIHTLHTVYEFGSFSEALSNLAPILLLALFGVLSFGLYIYAKRYVDPSKETFNIEGLTNRDRLMRAGIFGIAATAILIPFILFGFTLQYMRTYATYRDGKFNIAEGRINHFRDTISRSGDTLLLFAVDTLQFEQAPFENPYRQMREFHNGYFVRVAYIPFGENDKTILKLEIE